jgi:hypothetical protein
MLQGELNRNSLKTWVASPSYPLFAFDLFHCQLDIIRIYSTMSINTVGYIIDEFKNADVYIILVHMPIKIGNSMSSTTWISALFC